MNSSFKFSPGSHVSGESDEQALILAAQRDVAAFSAIYQRYLTCVYRYIRTHMNNDDDTTDLTQHIFLQELSALPGYQFRGTPFASWLFQIARNIINDTYRARSRQPTISWDTLPEVEHPNSEQDLNAIVIQNERLNRLL